MTGGSAGDLALSHTGASILEHIQITIYGVDKHSVCSVCPVCAMRPMRMRMICDDMLPGITNDA